MFCSSEINGLLGVSATHLGPDLVHLGIQVTLQFLIELLVLGSNTVQ
jgi:hypothetical protein